MSFFSHINYAASHEDGRSELRALALDADSRVLCITGSGSRVLDLLGARPREIVAVDFNPAQTALLALKLAALQTLDYDAYVRFLGLVSGRDRRHLYARIRPLLDPLSRNFWDRQSTRVLDDGVLYAGRWERFLRLIVAPAARMRGRRIERLFAAPSLREQARIWREEWSDAAFRRYLRWLSNRFVWAKLVREPGMRLVPRELDIAATVEARFERAAAHILFRESPWCSLLFYGRLRADGPLPPHLQRANFEVQRERAHTVRPVTASLASYLERPAREKFAAFSLSDFGSYADESVYAATWRAIQAAAAPGARFCERQFLVPRDPSQLPHLSLERDALLEAELTRRDDSVVYELLAGTFASR